ncbi:chemotaxis protein CheA [Archaeoglobus profundus]|uniref:Chemotaxis protein CheA n=1 Tax=Archaeoglobus profundus (strain DSM 5631 / JCM 9629 / NBRC 100127 / Av18) TaxID=572546 RepID=D2RE79_ARCPA|nr:chemotaxis protein CheA [Archaeoglobus profundus]ADB58423.1 CheA signal transduction histidine kinase [Archaeoglobus profundus DSM 5631]
MDLSEYKQEFLQEVKEYIDVMNQNFIKVEKGDLEALNEIFRVAHTIKGMAGFMGYKKLELLCHRLESAMGKVRDGVVNVTEDLIDVMLKAVDKIEEIVEKIESEDNDDVDIDEVISSLESIIGEVRSSKCEKKESKPFDNANLRVDVKLADDCVMKSVRATLILESLKDVCEVIGVDPDEDAMDSDDFDGTFSIYVKGDRKAVEDVMSKVGEVERFDIVEIKQQRIEKKVEKPVVKEQMKEEKLRKNESIRVNIEQLDTIMNLVGELVIGKGRLIQIAQDYDIPELKEAVSVMDKAITSLQDEIMRIRMVKVERVFSKFPRMVRDLARKLGKKVELIIEGQDTELDRTVLDEITDPLIHIIRNAVDHGIETPEERKKAGKSEVGKIVLSARREKNNVVIEIEDDGRGIDVEKVKKKAIEKGLITPAEAESMSEDEIKMLIFAPGFSTKDKATEVSGRGVGMDVVKTRVEKLGGNVKIYSEKGKGTKIVITLPPTVAITKALLIRVGNEDFAIPLSSVVEAIYVTEENYKVLHGTPFLYVRNNLIPAFRLRELFNIKNGKAEREVGIIVEREGDRIALIADAITDQLEIVIKPLTSFLSKVRGFSGITILGDGRVVPIIDVSTLLGR